MPPIATASSERCSSMKLKIHHIVITAIIIFAVYKLYQKSKQG